ncbi:MULTISPECIES: murein L,D-transpeptidase [unclassified Ruegeria]|uniref:L,D-transpeptidase family protein n=1 Tax=unclassified Ruegeria TaxID=2625375 RepID=UPI001488548B|nr:MULTISPECIES: L,D-transpeptidase family protein [unclassified Ruegeria]NOD33463.1 L,D-transpeptidase family protein [Ruegeria sp. HKCCD7296]NOE40863.1 L,D-transpeptidase family protein [Ruegeria sp. HKCCD7319]
MLSVFRTSTSIFLTACFTATASFANTASDPAPNTAFQMAVAEHTPQTSNIAEFYRTNGFSPIWVGETVEHANRRAALINALSKAQMHGLPQSDATVAALIEKMEQARSVRDLGAVEAELSRAFIEYADALYSGTVEPGRVDDGLVRTLKRRSAAEHLAGLADQGAQYLEQLPPQTRQYRALMKQKLLLEDLVNQGGWGATVPVSKLEFGDTGPNVVKLRNRLVMMGYMKPSASPSFDDALLAGVQAFQTAHGLEPDGVAGKGTITELNRPASDRLKAVHVALERERWLPRERGTRHILVNQADFSAKIVDDGQVTFETRAVIGKNTYDRRSPEFSDVMEHMVINPSWYVPRSIITKEYLPKLQSNPNAVGHIEITDRSGRQVNRGAVDFTQFTARNFPFAMRQPPSKSNALGLVKFMFPNKHNIYLHDTPQKSLFAREVRAFSHGCIRLAQPFEFAYALLAKQEEDPKAFFHRVLKTGKETKVELDQHVPVHLIYRTAYIGPKGQVQYRRDVYNRDAKIWDALQKAGVALQDVQG